MKIRFGKYDNLLGDKIIGFIYSQGYEYNVFGLMIWSKGIFIIRKGK